MRLSVCALEVTHGGLVGEFGQCLGLDVSAGAPAPGDELGGSHLCLDGPDALVIEAFEALFRSGFPFAVRPVPAAVGKD